MIRVHNELVSKNDCEFCALVDIATEMPTGLGNCGVSDLRTTKVILQHAALRLSIRDVVVRIGHSDYPIELLEYLPCVYDNSIPTLRAIAREVLDNHQLFEPEALQSYAALYWGAAYLESKSSKKLQDAWSIIQMACRGPNALTDRVDGILPQLVINEPIGLYVSVDFGRYMIKDLYEFLVNDGLMPDELRQPTERDYWGPDWPAGINMARVIDGRVPDDDGDFTDGNFSVSGLRALAIARSVSTRHRVIMEEGPPPIIVMTRE